MVECKHQWQPIDIAPYVPLAKGDSLGIKAKIVLVCLKCNTYKTIDMQRDKEQSKNFEFCTCGYCGKSMDKCNCGDN